MAQRPRVLRACTSEQEARVQEVRQVHHMLCSACVCVHIHTSAWPRESTCMWKSEVSLGSCSSGVTSFLFLRQCLFLA